MEDALRIAANLADTMTCFGRAEPGAIIEQSDGIRIIDVGSALRVFNTAVITEPARNEAEFRQCLTAADRHFRRRQLPWSIWISSDLLPRELAQGISAVALDYGLARSTVTPGMIATTILPSPFPAWLQIRRIKTAADRQSFCRILSRMFEGPSDQLTRMYSRESLWTNSFRGYLGSVEGKDVCSGFVVAANGSLGIYALATLPLYARRGCASSLIRHAAAESLALDGAQPFVLQAAETGVRLYQRLGFRQAGEFSLYCSV
jgi:GNAT superfamily N-acetyltransferase